MSRWEADARGRLQQAAITLFRERGYAEVTVADIAKRAGLTKRSFFNHFTDKREVLFADAETFQRAVTDHLADIDAEIAPLHAALGALTHGGLSLASYGPSAATRRHLIQTSTELQERNLIKMASLTRGLRDGLVARAVAPRTATLTAQAAITVFDTAYNDWIDNPNADFTALIGCALDDLRAATNQPQES